MTEIEGVSIHQVGGAPGGEAFLLDTGSASALVDSGFSFSAPEMVRNIEAVLGGRPLDYVLLTHSHYDHASGSVFCKQQWPEVKVCASAIAADIFARPGARRVMKQMNASAAQLFGMADNSEEMEKLSCDVRLNDGDEIRLGEYTLVTVAAPGHTRCSIAFWCPELRLLLSSETAGLPTGDGKIMTAYLTGYQTTIDFINRAKALRPEHILLPHIGVISGGVCDKFFDDALYWSEKTAQLICDGHRAGKTPAEIGVEYKAAFYTPDVARTQPEAAFDLNLEYLVPMVINELM